MVDKLTKKRRSANMRAIRNVHTRPEIIVRRIAHSLGFRFRLHRKDLPGRPDLVFAGRKKIILVHGCFWHQHPSATCIDARIPESRQEYWIPKFERNRARDISNLRELKGAGWSVLVVWECEIEHTAKLTRRLQRFLST